MGGIGHDTVSISLPDAVWGILDIFITIMRHTLTVRGDKPGGIDREKVPGRSRV